MKEPSEVQHAEQVRDLFDEIVELPQENRAIRLEQISRKNPALCREIEGLLRAHGSPAPLLDGYGQLVQGYRDAIIDLSAHSFNLDFSGQILYQYEIIERLGSGGMGTVYKAQDTRLERPVAIKLLSPSLELNHLARERFLQEARAAAALDHPNICTVYEIGQTPTGSPFIAMAYIDGESLRHGIARGPLSIEESIKVAIQIAAGLEHAHAAGIIHRDIKPANVMVALGGTIKLVDFGIAKILGVDRTNPGQNPGTISYMSPEQIRGESIDARTDIWSLGVLLYEMVTGTRPFAGEQEATILHAILHREPEPAVRLRSDIPAGLAHVIERALAKRADDRYPDTATLLADLRGIESGHPLVAATGNTPAPLTRFVGRDKEMGEIKHLLSRNRLLTLTGPAGTGKTRLALELSSSLRGMASDGIYFIPLDAITDSSLVASAIGHALMVIETASCPFIETLQQALRDRHLLLILDNFEQVTAASPVVATILGACPHVKVVVTSRVPLRIAGEQEFPVGPLPLPEHSDTIEAIAGSPAVQLFLDRARAARPEFALESNSAPAVAELCAQLDGLPLAIELAAARIRLLSPQAIVARLSRRLDLLKHGPLDLPPRHQTLRAAIAWSYELLDTEQKRFFRHASVFVGGFTIEAAEAVCGTEGIDILEILTTLVEQSLLQQKEGPDGEPRFRMLETLRAYGVEQLDEAGETKSLQRAHARYFQSLADHISLIFPTAEGMGLLDGLEAEHDNMRSAISWAIEQRDADTAFRIVADMSAFWMVRGYLHEGYTRFQQLFSLDHQGVDPVVYARSLNGVGALAYVLGNNHEAQTWLEQGLAAWRAMEHRNGMAMAMNDLTWVALELSDFEKAERLAHETLSLCREKNNERGMAVALYNLGWLENYRGNYWEAHKVLVESVELHRSSGDQRGTALALACLGWAEQYHGRFAEAGRYLDDARTLLLGADDLLFEAWTHCIDGFVHIDQGQYDQAVIHLDRGIDCWKRVGHRGGIGWGYCSQALIELHRNRIAAAPQLLREASALFQAISCPWGESLVSYCRGHLALREGNAREAESHFIESLKLRGSLGLRLGMAECLEGLAEIHITREALIQATELLAASGAERVRLGAPLPPRVRDWHRERIAVIQSRLGENEFAQAWKNGEAMTIANVAATLIESPRHL